MKLMHRICLKCISELEKKDSCKEFLTEDHIWEISEGFLETDRVILDNIILELEEKYNWRRQVFNLSTNTLTNEKELLLLEYIWVFSPKNLEITIPKMSDEVIEKLLM